MRDDGFIVFKKLVAREDNEYTILYDDEGGFAGVEQNARISGRTVKVQIELPYCLHVHLPQGAQQVAWR